MKYTTILTLTVATFTLTNCAHKIKPRINITDADLPNTSIKLGAVNNSRTLNISNLASRISNNNPQLRTAKLTLSEAAGRINAAGVLPNPTLGIGFNKSIPSSEGGLEVSYSQRFPITNKLRLEKRVSAQALQIARAEIKVAEQALVADAQLIAVEILHLNQLKSNIRTQISSLETITNFINAAASRGELSALDASQTKLEIQALKIKQQQLTSKQQLLSSQLKKYIGLTTSKPLNLTGKLPSNSVPSRALSLTNRADYRAKLLQLSYAKSNILLAKANRYDDVEMTVRGAINREEDQPAGLETEGEVGFGISIPLPLYTKNRGNIQATTATAQKNSLAAQSLAQQIKLEVANQKQAMQLWNSQNASIKKTLLPMAEKTSADLETAYKKGLSDFTSFLKSKNQAIQLKTQLIENNLKFQQARVKYFAALGKSNSAF